MSANVDANASLDATKDTAKVEEKQPDPAELQRQLEHANALLTEERNAKDFWHQKATAQHSQPAPAPAQQQQVAQVEDDEDYSLVDIVTENDKGKLQKMIAKEARKIAQEAIKAGGFISQADAQQMVQGKVAEVQAAEGLAREFPELFVKDSPLFLEAGRQLEMLDRNPAYGAVPDVEKARIAATMAQNTLLRTGKMPAPAQQQSREQRIAAQQSGGGNYGGQPDQESEELTPTQKAAAAKYGVSEEAYKKSLKMENIIYR